MENFISPLSFTFVQFVLKYSNHLIFALGGLFYVLLILAFFIPIKKQKKTTLLFAASLLFVFVTQLLAPKFRFSGKGVFIGSLGYLQIIVFVVWALRKEAQEKPHSERSILPPSSNSSFFQKYLGITAIFFLVALPIRLWELVKYPLVFEGEFSDWGYKALQIKETGKLFWIETLSPDPKTYLLYLEKSFLVFSDILAFLFWIFGSGIGPMKILPTLFGLGAVFIAWWFGRRWFEKGVAETSAILIAISPYMIALSRNLWAHIILIVPYTILTLHFMLLSLQKPSLRSIGITTLLITLSLYLYRAIYMIIPMVIIFWGWYYIKNKTWRNDAKKPLLCSFLMGLILSLPFLYYFWLKNYGDFLFSFSVYEVKPTQPAFLSLVQNLWFIGHAILIFGSKSMFEGIGGNWGYTGFLHLPPTICLFCIGVGTALARIKSHPIYPALLILALLGLIPGFISVIFPRRIIVFEAPFFLLSGIGFITITHFIKPLFGKKWKKVSLVCMGCLSLFMIILGWGIYVRKAQTAPFNTMRYTAKEISQAIRKDMVITLFDDAGLMQTVSIFSANDFSLKEIRNRFSPLYYRKILEHIAPVSECERIHFIARGDKNKIIEYHYNNPKFLQEAQQLNPQWNFRWHYDETKPLESRFLWFTVPLSDLKPATVFVQTYLVSEPLPQKGQQSTF